jgi:hypothetical protein
MRMRRDAQTDLCAYHDKLFEAAHDQDKVGLLEVMVELQERLREADAYVYRTSLASADEKIAQLEAELKVLRK